jgi:Ala-tRNA(Pro) deacylase
LDHFLDVKTGRLRPFPTRFSNPENKESVMSPKLLRAYLDEAHIDYMVQNHLPAMSAPRVAQAAHVPGRNMAKVVIVWLDNRLVMAVLPSTQHIDLAHLRQLTGARDVRLAREEEFAARFDQCELGAMPPFGNLYDMEVFVAEALTEDEVISFNACTHTEIMTMAYEDFERLVRPTVLPFGAPTLV